MGNSIEGAPKQESIQPAEQKPNLSRLDRLVPEGLSKKDRLVKKLELVFEDEDLADAAGIVIRDLVVIPMAGRGSLSEEQAKRLLNVFSQTLESGLTPKQIEDAHRRTALKKDEESPFSGGKPW